MKSSRQLDRKIINLNFIELRQETIHIRMQGKEPFGTQFSYLSGYLARMCENEQRRAYTQISHSLFFH